MSRHSSPTSHETPINDLALSFVQNRDQVFVPHDAVAAIAMMAPELFTWKARPARCETAGSLTAGATVIDRRPQAAAGHVLVAEDVEVTEVSARILEAIRSLDEGPAEEDDPAERR
jgi:inosine-uridine nucleoside N-ribohydrolase